MGESLYAGSDAADTGRGHGYRRSAFVFGGLEFFDSLHVRLGHYPMLVHVDHEADRIPLACS